MTQRSTKGASKQRRDAINERVGQIRDLLPLSEVGRSRLSQLQVMALARAYIAKSNFFTANHRGLQEDDDRSSVYGDYFDFLQIVPGFLLITGLDGRLLYISDTIADYLGNSAMDTLTQTETVFDLIDQRDQDPLRSAMDAAAAGNASSGPVSFSCRMNTSVRNVRYATTPAKTGFERFRVMQISGRFIVPSSGCAPAVSRQHAKRFGGLPNSAAFVAFCSPRLAVSDSLSAGEGVFAPVADTTVFKSLHTMGMQFAAVDHIGQFYLGGERQSVAGKSWYSMIVPEDLELAQRCHMELIRSYEIGDVTAFQSTCIRVQERHGDIINLHVIMRMRTDDDDVMQAASRDHQLQPMIVCVNRVVDDQQAASIRSGEMQECSAAESANATASTFYPSQNGCYFPDNGFAIPDGIFGDGSFSTFPPASVQVGSFDVAATEPMQRQDGRRAARHQTKRSAEQAVVGVGDGSALKVQRMSNVYDLSQQQLQSASFSTMPSPPQYQQHWCSSSSSGGSFVSVSQQQLQHGRSAATSIYSMDSSPFPSTFRSLTPPESSVSPKGAACTIPFGVDLSFGLKQESTDMEAAMENPLLRMTPDQSPASCYDAPSPAQSDLSAAGSTKMLQDMDIFIPKTFRHQQQSPPAHIVPSEKQTAFVCSSDLADLDDISFFDLTSADDGLFAAAKLGDLPSTYQTLPPVSTRPRMIAAPSVPAAAVSQEHILINSDYLPELDLSCVTSVLDCLETKMTSARPSSWSGSAAAGSRGSRQVGTVGLDGALADELLIQNLQMSMGCDMMWSFQQQQQQQQQQRVDEMMMFNGYSARHATVSY